MTHVGQAPREYVDVRSFGDPFRHGKLASPYEYEVTLRLFASQRGAELRAARRKKRPGRPVLPAPVNGAVRERVSEELRAKREAADWAQEMGHGFYE